MRIVTVIAAVLMPVLLLGCEQGGISKSGAGTVVGAVAGGVVGNQFGKGSGKVLATAVGAVVGGIVGHEIGRSLDEADRRAAMEAEYRALEHGQSGNQVPWRNPDSGHYGMVVPEEPYKVGSQNCRKYAHTIYVDGQPQTMRGTACRNPDGTWRNIG